MDIVSYSALRQNLAAWLDKMTENHAPLFITRNNGVAAVMLSLDDFKGYEETAYLAASPKNRDRLNAAITDLRQGKGREHPLDDDSR